MGFEIQNRFHTETVRGMDVRCPGTDTRCGSEELASGHQVVLIRRGVYHNYRGHHRILADSRQVLFYNAGETYRVFHPQGGDACTVLSFSPTAIADVFAGLDARNQWQPERPFPFSHGPAEPRAVLACHRLRHRLRHRQVTPLEMEETALDILAATVRPALQIRGARKDRTRAATARRRKELVDAARLTIASSPEAAHSLTNLAKTLECSPFHLTRSFRAQVGVPLYRYLLWIRLCIALDRLADGEANLSALAFDIGFSSHSRFTAAFGRILGSTPSAFRKSCRPPL